MNETRFLSRFNQCIFEKTKITDFFGVFFKTRIQSFSPYVTEILKEEKINNQNLDIILSELIELEKDTEYAFCINGSIPSYDHRTNGVRLTFTTSLQDHNYDNDLFKFALKFSDVLDKKNFTPVKRQFISLVILLIMNKSLNKTLNKKSILSDIESVILIQNHKNISLTIHTNETFNNQTQTTPLCDSLRTILFYRSTVGVKIKEFK